jgi:hypothetical protein
MSSRCQRKSLPLNLNRAPNGVCASALLLPRISSLPGTPRVVRILFFPYLGTRHGWPLIVDRTARATSTFTSLTLSGIGNPWSSPSKRESFSSSSLSERRRRTRSLHHTHCQPTSGETPRQGPFSSSSPSPPLPFAPFLTLVRPRVLFLASPCHRTSANRSAGPSPPPLGHASQSGRLLARQAEPVGGPLSQGLWAKIGPWRGNVSLF